jgi:hypothetical protein
MALLVLLRQVVLEAQLQLAAAAAEEGEVVEAVVVREEMELMVLLLLAEQVEQAFPSRFLATMEEMPKYMVRVEMVDQIAALVTPLEQMVWQIQVKVVEEDAQRPTSHHTIMALSLWVEMVDPV